MTIGQGQQGQQAMLNTGHDALAGEQYLGLQTYNRGVNQGNQAAALSGNATDIAGNLAGASGQSAAQAQLQQGLNQAQASNLALARSGRGFGGSAAAMGQAVDANAAAGQNAANSSALLRFQGQQAAAGIYGQAAQQQQQAALANSQQGLGLYGQGYNTALQAQQAGYGVGLQGNQLGGQIGAQGANEFFAGQNAAKAFTDAQHQADYEREALAVQQYGISSGAQTAANAAQQQQNAAIVGAAGTIGGAVVGTFASPGVGTAVGAAAGHEAAQRAYTSDIRAKTNVQPADGQVPAGMQGEDLEVALTRPRMQPPRPVSAEQIKLADLHAKLDALLAKDKPQVQPIIVAQAAPRPVRQAVSPVDENFSGYYRVPAGFDPQADRAAEQQVTFPEEVTSDEDAKGGKGGAGDEIADTFGNLHGYSYNYRDPARDGDGRQYGIMAQDLAATPAGRTAVEPDERGMLTVNAPKLGMMTAAATGAHERRIAELEAQLDALLGKSKDKGSAAAPRTGTADTAALDAAARRQGAPVNAPRGTVAMVPTARFADYNPPTARYADVTAQAAPASQYSYDYSQPTEVIPVAVGSADPTPYGGVDFAALDEAQRRQGGTVREETY